MLYLCMTDSSTQTSPPQSERPYSLKSKQSLDLEVHFEVERFVGGSRFFDLESGHQAQIDL